MRIYEINIYSLDNNKKFGINNNDEIMRIVKKFTKKKTKIYVEDIFYKNLVQRKINDAEYFFRIIPVKSSVNKNFVLSINKLEQIEKTKFPNINSYNYTAKYYFHEYAIESNVLQLITTEQTKYIKICIEISTNNNENNRDHDDDYIDNIINEIFSDV